MRPTMPPAATEVLRQSLEEESVVSILLVQEEPEAPVRLIRPFQLPVDGMTPQLLSELRPRHALPSRLQALHRELPEGRGNRGP